MLRALGHLGFGITCAAAGLPFAKYVPNFLVPDDGFFYAQIAFNLAHLHRSTFDGIHTTSGYHLPWGFVLAGVSLVVGLFTKAKTVHLFAYLATSFTLIGWTSHHFFRSWLFRIAAFLLLIAHFSLTEMTLAAPLLLALLRESTPEMRRRGHAFEPALGFVLALVRVDLCCVSLFLAVTHRERARGVRLGLATMAGVAAQLAIMQLMFGHFFSVAAELKTAGGLSAIRWHVPLNLFASTFVFSVYAAHVLIAALAIKLTPTKSTVRLILASLSFIVVHIALSVVRPWYFTPGWIMLLFVLERSLEATTLTNRWRTAPTVLAVVVTLAFVIHSLRIEIFYRKDQTITAAALDDLRRLVPAETPVFMVDKSGYLGFFSEQRIVDGDGLVNDYAYARRLHARSLSGYLDEENICWIITDDADAHPQLDVGGLVVDTPELTLWSAHRRVHLTDFLLYRLDAARCRATAKAIPDLRD